MYKCAPIYLDEQTLQMLEEIQFQYGATQSQIIRECLRAALPIVEEKFKRGDIAPQIRKRKEAA